jgi:putative hydrolase of the HAD superfamily
MIKALIFDCLGVVLTEYNSSWIARHLSPEDVQKLEQSALYPKNDLNQISDQELYLGLSKLANQSPKSTETEIKSFVAPVAGMPELIKSYHKNYQTALLSNASSSLRDKLDQFNLQPLFDHFIISGEVGVRKPDPAIFRLALSRLAIEPAEAVFIDDRPENLAAAAALGIKPILFFSAAELQSDLKKLLATATNQPRI